MDITLPVINLDDTDAQIAIKNALETTGFFYLSGHNIEGMDELLEKMKDFCSLDINHPLKIATRGKPGDGVAGYYPVETVNTYAIFGKSGNPDCCEQFTWKKTISKEMRENESYLSSEQGYKSNPDNKVFDPELMKLYQSVFDQFDVYTRKLFSLICGTYNVDSSFWKPWFDPFNCSSLTYLHYPNPKESNLKDWDNGRLRMAPHCDLDVLTVLNPSNSSGGLQIKPKNCTEWVSVPYVTGALVVNAGEIFQYWTEGKILATEHRIGMPSESELHNSDRTSIVFSFLPRGDIKLIPFNAQTTFAGSTLGEFMHTVTSRYST